MILTFDGPCLSLLIYLLSSYCHLILIFLEKYFGLIEYYLFELKKIIWIDFLLRLNQNHIFLKKNEPNWIRTNFIWFKFRFKSNLDQVSIFHMLKGKIDHLTSWIFTRAVRPSYPLELILRD